MARVSLVGNFAQLAGGESELELDAPNVRKLLDELARQFPALAPHLEVGIAVAIDGEIYQDAWFAKIEPDSEVHIMPAIGGG